MSARRLAWWDAATDRVMVVVPCAPALWMNAGVPVDLDPAAAFDLSRDLREAWLARERAGNQPITAAGVHAGVVPVRAGGGVPTTR